MSTKLLQAVQELLKCSNECLTITDQLFDNWFQFARSNADWCVNLGGWFKDWEFEAWADSVSSAGFIEEPRNTGHRERLQQAVDRPAGAFQFLSQAIGIPSPFTHDEMQRSEQMAQTFALSEAAFSVSSLLLGHARPLSPLLAEVQD